MFKSNLEQIITLFRRSLLMFTILILTYSLSGCISTKYVQKDNIGTPSQKNAYVIVKQKLGKGNLDRIGMSLYVNGKTKINGGAFNRTKGIELESADKPIYGFNIYGEIKKVSSSDDRSAYHIWEIPAKKFSSGPGAGLLFIRNIESQESSVFGTAVPDLFGVNNSPFECMFMTVPDQGSVKKGDKPVKRITIFGKSNLTDMLWFKRLQKEKIPDATFSGNYFIIDKPGVYYLGDVTISGKFNRIKKEKFWDDNKKSINIKKSFVDNSAQAKEYLKNSGLETFPFYNIFSSWQDINIGDFRTYVNEPLLLREIYDF